MNTNWPKVHMTRLLYLGRSFFLMAAGANVSWQSYIQSCCTTYISDDSQINRMQFYSTLPGSPSPLRVLYHTLMSPIHTFKPPIIHAAVKVSTGTIWNRAHSSRTCCTFSAGELNAELPVSSCRQELYHAPQHGGDICSTTVV